MPKSADETAERGDKLKEDSDVIELTEEIPAGHSSADSSANKAKEDGDPQEQPAQDEFDALTREMPEFRVPDQDESADDASTSDATSDEEEEEVVELRETVDPDSEPQDRASQNRASNDGGQEVPSAAIISGRKSTRNSAVEASEDVDKAGAEDDLTETVIIEAQERPSEDEDAQDGSDEVTSVEEVPVDEAPAEEDAGYDRQEMVKTIQMSAIDREAFERQVQAEQLEESALLLDHSHAPDVVVFSPRVLTTRWQEGGPLLRAGEVDPPTGEVPVEVEAKTVEEDETSQPSPPTEPGDRPEPNDKPEQIREFHDDEEEETEASDEEDTADTLDEDDLPEIEPDAVEFELDSEAIEDADEVKPPPKPAPQSGPSPSAKPPTQRNERPPKKQPSKAQAQGGAEDTELNGLVQELLDENKQSREERKKKPQKPRSPRETWFQKVFTEEYLRTLPRDIHRQTKREVDFIEESFDLDESDRVLDLACGFGRHAIELTKRGYEVAGLDLSMPLLQKALNEAQKQSLSNKFIHGDMRELSFEQIFSACFLWQTSFGFFDEQTNFRVLRGIHRALKPGGRLLIDVLNRDHIVTEMPHRLWWEGVDCVFLEEVELDHRTSVLHTKRSFIYEDGSPPLEQNTYIRVYALHELCQLLRAAGFAVREVSGELHHRGRFLGPASSRIIVQAQKRPPKGGRK